MEKIICDAGYGSTDSESTALVTEAQAAAWCVVDGLSDLMDLTALSLWRTPFELGYERLSAFSGPSTSNTSDCVEGPLSLCTGVRSGGVEADLRILNYVYSLDGDRIKEVLRTPAGIISTMKVIGALRSTDLRNEHAQLVLLDATLDANMKKICKNLTLITNEITDEIRRMLLREVYLVGEFGMSPYLRSEIERKVLKDRYELITERQYRVNLVANGVVRHGLQEALHRSPVCIAHVGLETTHSRLDVYGRVEGCVTLDQRSAYWILRKNDVFRENPKTGFEIGLVYKAGASKSVYISIFVDLRDANPPNAID
ncbi:hypothetical protein BJX70DRAFT_402418 [Aspergillus crustosus]